MDHTTKRNENEDETNVDLISIAAGAGFDHGGRFKQTESHVVASVAVAKQIYDSFIRYVNGMVWYGGRV
jgi:hypothetical protein